MAVKVLIDLKVQPEKIDELINVLKDAIYPDTRKYEGNIDIDTYQNQDIPTDLRILETWESRGHHEKYFAWRQERGDLDTLGSFLSAPPTVAYLDLKS